MSQTDQGKKGPCAVPCDQCALSHEAGRDVDPAAPAGWRMVAASAAVFLLPLISAIAGAGCVRGSAARELAAALAGFAAGAAGAAAIVHRIKPRPKGIL